MECTDCKMEVERLLCEVPSKWREQLVNLVCDYIANLNQCPKVMECLNNESVVLDYNCLVTTQQEWENMPLMAKLQVIIDKVCETIEIATFQIEDTPSVHLSGEGTIIAPLKAHVIKDVVTGGGDNILQITDNGVYVPPQETGTTIIVDDTDTVDLDLTADILTANVILNPVNTNIISAGTAGLLAQYEYIQDLQDNLEQHLIFEVPALRDATYPVDGVGLQDAFRVVLATGDFYANDFSNPNPNVKVFWDDNGTIENTLANVVTTTNFLEHTYPGTSDFYRTGYVKTYNGDYLTELRGHYGTAISGFKFLKGGEHITTIQLGGYAQGHTGVYDFRGLFNLDQFSYGVGGETTYKGVSPITSYDNMEDLLSLTYFVVYGKVRDKQDFKLVSPTLNYIFLNFIRHLRDLEVKNKVGLQIAMNASAVDTIDMQETTLKAFTLQNCGGYFNSYINKMIFKLTAGLGAGQGEPYFTQGTGVFDLGICYNFGILQINGVQDETVNTVVPTKILFPDFATDGRLRYVNANQDFVKDECVISLNNNSLINGDMALTGNEFIHAFGKKYLHEYYNPPYDPLFGTAAKLYVTVTAGAVATLNMGGIGAGIDNAGYRYNSIPTITSTGPGAGMTYTVVMQLGSANTSPTGILAAGSGYVVNQVITLDTPPGPTVTLIPATLKVTSVDGLGGINGYEIQVLGEYTTALPATLSHAGGFILDTAHKWNVRRTDVTAGGAGYNQTTSIFTTQVSTFNGTGTGTASANAKTAIDGLHNKGWRLRW